MSYRIMDPSALDIPADFSIAAPIPASKWTQRNDDGSRQNVTIAVKGGTVRTALQVLSSINDAEAYLEAATGDSDLPEDLETLPDSEQTELFNKFIDEIHTPFLVTEISIQVDYVDTSVPSDVVEITVTAPTVRIGAEAIMAITTDSYLSKIASGFMPQSDDDIDEYDDNE